MTSKSSWLLLALALSVGWDKTGSKAPADPDLPRLMELCIDSLPPASDSSNRFFGQPGAIALGGRLFASTALSGNGQVSCATCHRKELDWTDGLRLAQGLGKATRNSPSLWNTAYNRWFFWDGRADSAWSQALQPIENPKEMGGSRLAVLHTIRDDAALHAAYRTVTGESLDDVGEVRARIDHHFVNVGKIIAAYEGTLTTPASPFDEYVRARVAGDTEAADRYPAAARRGLSLFRGKAGCTNCHSGPLFTNLEFHNIRLLHFEGGRYEGIRKLVDSPWNRDGAHSDDPSSSRIDVVRLVKRNWGEFKVPSLRRVSATAPYMHDGRFASLGDVLDFYSELKNAVDDGHVNEKLIVAQHFTPGEKADLIAFLETL